MALTKNQAIDEAITALDVNQDERYEGEEREDPVIAKWIQKQLDAMEMLETLKGSEATVEDCYKAFIAVPPYDFEAAKAVLRKYLGA